MKIVNLTGGCGSGSCPTVYETDRGTFIVQGNVLDGDAQSSVTLPEGESAVEVPREILVTLAKLLQP